MDNRVRFRLIIISIGVIIVLIVASILVALLHRPVTAVNLYSSQVMARNIQFPDYSSNNNHVRFFTGSAFADIDTSNFSTKALTREFALPQVTDVQWHGNYVLVHTATSVSSDDLYQFTRDGKDNITWWLFDISKQQFSPITSSQADYTVANTVWRLESGNTYYQLLQKSSGEQLVQLRNLDGSNNGQTVSVRSTTFMVDTAGGLLVQQGVDCYLLVNQKLNKVDITSSKRPLVLGNGSIVVYEQLSADGKKTDQESSVAPGKLMAFDIGEAKNRQISKTNSTNYATDGSNLIMLSDTQQNTSAPRAAGESQPLLVSLVSGGKTEKPTFEDQDTLNIGRLKTVHFKQDMHQLLLTNTSDDLVLVSDQKAVQQYSSSYKLLFTTEDSIDLNGATATYDGVTNMLDIYVTASGDIGTLRQRIMTQLADQKKDPNQVKKQWHQADGLVD